MKFSFNILKIFLFYLFLITSVYAESIEKISINGNKRISNKTIQMFANIEIKDEISDKKINLILKDLYDTNYFIYCRQNMYSLDPTEIPCHFYILELYLWKILFFFLHSYLL